MAVRKATPALTQTPAEPALERFFNLKAAAEWFDLNDPADPDDQSGMRWLRDGFTRPSDGSKGRKFPGRKMSGRLIFSETDLITIAQIALEETEAKQRADETPKPSTGRPRRRTPVAA